MNLVLDAAQQDTYASFRSFVDNEIIPHAAAWDAEERLPEDLIAKLADEGYLGAVLPESYGGRGMDNLEFGLLNEELGRGSSSVRGLMMVQNMIGQTLLRWGSERQKQTWLPRLAGGEVIASLALTEREAGTDVKEVQTEATLEGDCFVLNGHKLWISLGQIAGVYLVLARHEGRLSAFLVERDTPGLTVTPMTGLSGVRSTMLAELRFEDCRIPTDNLVGRHGFGLAPVVFTALDLGRYAIAWGCVGIAQACIESSVKHVNERQQFGKYLKEHQLLQRMITDMICNVKAARLLCKDAARLRDANSPNAFVETMVAKYFASTTATKTANDAVQIHGAIGYQDSHAVQRHLRDAQVMEIIEGTTQIHQVKIAEYSYAQYL